MRRKICTIGNSRTMATGEAGQAEARVRRRGLRWEEVRPVLARHFAGRFNVISPG